MRRTYPLVATLAVLTGAGIAMATGAQAAVQVQSPPNHVIALETAATLRAKGAAVAVTVDIICPAGVHPYGAVSVYEKAQGKIASGTAYFYPTCTGEPQAITVTVPTTVRPFHRGSASADASMSYYYGSISRDGSDQRTIQIS